MEEETFNVKKNGSDIILTGNLRANDFSTLNKFLNSLNPGTYKVDADTAIIRPESVDAWIRAVNKNLTSEHHLTYTNSHLNSVLLYDDRYEHKTSTFADPYVA